MERIEALQKEVAEQRKKNEASYRAALAGNSRMKNQTDITDASYKEADFTSQLRKYPASPLKVPKGTTVPTAFNLSTGSKRELEETDAYVPMAQQIVQFQRRTPTRHHLCSRQSQENGPSRMKAEKLKLTHPHPPQLLMRQRNRPAVVKSTVEMCPFSFEQREQERKAQKVKRLEELKHEEVPKFKARPLPDFHEVSLPEKKMTEPTKPAPFKLSVDEQGSVKRISTRWEQMIKEELKQQAEAACFKAQPNASTHKEPFVPKKENRSILVPEGFQLSTERRAKERLDFERALKEKEALRAQMEAQHTREREQHEKEEIARLRQEQVHKAQPVRRYKPMELKHSEATLTVPQSPNFSDRFRM